MAPNKRASTRDAKKRKADALELLDQIFHERALGITVPEGEEIARQALEIARESLDLIDEVLKAQERQEAAESQWTPTSNGGQAGAAARQQEQAERTDELLQSEQGEEPPLDDWLVSVPW